MVRNCRVRLTVGLDGKLIEEIQIKEFINFLMKFWKFSSEFVYFEIKLL